MSEIFNWLKKAERERGSAMPEVVVFPQEIGGRGQVRVEAFETAEKKQPAEMAPEAEFVTEPPDLLTRLNGSSNFDIETAAATVRTVLDPLTMVGEQYRILQAKLSSLQKQRGLKKLLVTSALPNEGKTFTACCLAGVIGQEQKKKILLIDADLRKANAGKLLGVSEQDPLEGLSTVLTGRTDVRKVLMHSANSGLYFLPAGEVASNPVELLHAPKLEEVMRQLEEVFDWVIVDSPPVLSLADTSLLAPLCDATLLVVHANRTPTKLVNEAIDRVGREKICGVVMNRMRNLKSSRYYNNYYKKYYKRVQDKSQG